MIDRCNDAVAKEVEVDVGQDNSRMNSPLLPPLPVLILESVEDAKRLLLLLLLMPNNLLFAEILCVGGDMYHTY